MGLRVLVVVSSDALRGAEVEGTQLALELAALGHTARAVALSPSTTGGLAIECLGPSRLAWSTLRNLRAAASDYDVVVAYGSSTLPACAIALRGSGVPFVYRSIGDPTVWVRGRLHRWRTGLLFRRAAAVVALWDDAAVSIRHLYGVRSERVHVIPNGRPAVAPGGVSRAVARQRLGLPSDAQVVAVVGAHSQEKRPLLAVEAVAALPEVWLLMVGVGPLSEQVAERCRQDLPGRHVLTGAIAPLDEVWAASDVALLTSSTEGMPGVLIEAQLAGVPVVSSDVGAVRLVVDNGLTGLLVSANAPPGEFAAAVRAVLREPSRMSEAALVQTDRFSWSTVAPLWADVLARCTSRASGPPIDRA